MRAGIAVLVSASVLGTASVASAQNLNDIINQLPAIAQSGIAKLAESEWKKLPPTELDCINQKLRERGDSTQSLAQRGIFPLDSRVAEIRSQCRASSAAIPSDPSSAQTKYAVDGVAVGSRLKLDSAAYREYKCSPSEQFEGLTWCQRTRNEQDRRGAPTATYSILHAQDGGVVYVNRFQEPAYHGRNEPDKDIQQYSRKLGEPARITKMPHRAGLPDATIALWGKTTLEPLDQDSIRILAEGRSPKKGLLIDHIGNFARSAKEGLPVYRIGGGAGFLWAASFDQDGRGTLRFAAVDASGLPSPLPAQAPDVIAPAPQPPTPQQVNAPEASLAELKQTIESLRADLAKSADKISQLEKANAEADRQARLDNESARREIERTKAAERAELAPLLAKLEAEKAALDRAWEILAYGAIIGFIAVLTVLAWVQLTRWRSATKAGREQSKAATAPLLIETHSSESPQRSLRTSGAREQDAKDGDGRAIETGEETKPGKGVDRGDLVNQLAETLGVQAPAPALADLAPAPSGSAVPESAAKTHGGRHAQSGEQTKPGRSPDHGDPQPAETPGVQAPALALADLAPTSSDSVVPEGPAKADGGRNAQSGEETKPGKGHGDLVPAETSGAQAPALSLSELAPAISDSVVPEHAAKSDGEPGIEPGEDTKPDARRDQDETAKQRESHQLPS